MDHQPQDENLFPLYLPLFLHHRQTLSWSILPLPLDIKYSVCHDSLVLQGVLVKKHKHTTGHLMGNGDSKFCHIIYKMTMPMTSLTMWVCFGDVWACSLMTLPLAKQQTYAFNSNSCLFRPLPVLFIICVGYFCTEADLNDLGIPSHLMIPQPFQLTGTNNGTWLRCTQGMVLDMPTQPSGYIEGGYFEVLFQSKLGSNTN